MNDGKDNATGKGKIALELHGNQAVFTELSYRYPLKLLSPSNLAPGVALAYILSYGGGLVGGDRVYIDVELSSGATLLLLTQGSTKIFKQRPGQRLSNLVPSNKDDVYGTTTVQKLDVIVHSGALLLLLPDPVTCFAEAVYNQLQTFRLQEGASAVILDWFTSGRMSVGEEWMFTRYYSLNEVWLGEKRLARDILLLEHTKSNYSLKDKMQPYSCYANLLLFGPKTLPVVSALSEAYRSITVFQHSSPPTFIWSLSNIDHGCIVRVAGRETETVKNWLKESLRPLENVVGPAVFARTFV